MDPAKTRDQTNHSKFPQRICNSDDMRMSASSSPLATLVTTSPWCLNAELQYPEIRVHNGDWESPLFYGWLLQIFLSEFLEVPATVGMGMSDSVATSFYHPHANHPLQYSNQTYAFEQIQTANLFNGNCANTNSSCVHVLPEVWIGQEKRWRQALLEGSIDQPNDDGMVGKISWYVPFFTAKQYPQVTTNYGMNGDRELLASIFHRPFSWVRYCRDISPTNCVGGDNVAERPPQPGEEDMYFHPIFFGGYFAPTYENNCTINPENCTGHIVGAPCTWSTNVEAQAYWNNIALQSSGPRVNGGYSYGQMIQIWRAANHTRSHVMMWWWTPDATIEEFRGTDFEFQRVALPEPTSACRRARLNPLDRCSETQEVRRGLPDGSCDNEHNALQKVVASSLREMTLSLSNVDRSPGYEGILNFKITQLSMNKLLRQWVENHRTGFAARQAICNFVYDNRDELSEFMPHGFPRSLDSSNSYQTPILILAKTLGVLSMISVAVGLFLLFKWQNAAVFAKSQLFTSMILLGLVLVSIGSILFASEPRDSVCTMQIWVITLGYTLEFVPILVQVSVINRVMASALQAKRTVIRSRDLLLTVVCVVVSVATFLLTWTLVDPPQRNETRYLMEGQSEIQRSISCGSKSTAWAVIAICWEGFLIVCATMLAIQSQRIHSTFHRRTHLGLLIYSHLIFFALRAVVLVVTGDTSDFQSAERGIVKPTTSAVALSFLVTADVSTAMMIFIVPKFFAAFKGKEPSKFSITPGNLPRVVSRMSQPSPNSRTRSSRTVSKIVANAQLALRQHQASKKHPEQESEEFSRDFSKRDSSWALSGLHNEDLDDRDVDQDYDVTRENLNTGISRAFDEFFAEDAADHSIGDGSLDESVYNT